MFGAIFRFELRQQLRSPVFWLAAFVFSLLAFGAITTDAVTIGGSIGNVNRNAPFVIVQILALYSLIGVFLTTAFVAGAVLRDFEHGTHEMFFATPLTKTAYLGGRFLGALTAAILVFIPVALAVALGGLMPWLDPERVGPFMVTPYLAGFAIFLIPNLFLMSAAFFGLATLTRSMMGTYLGLIGFFVLYFVSATILGDLENRQLAALLDPFGLASYLLDTRYWTTVERNMRVPELTASLLRNRLLWSGVGLAALVATFATFRFSVAPTRRQRKRMKTEAMAAPLPPPVQGGVPLVQTRHDGVAVRAALMRQTRLEIGRILRSLAFPIILAFGVLNLIGSTSVLDQLFGTPVYPVTHLMLQTIQGSFLLFVVIVATIYAGETVWRDRQTRMDEVVDALPVPATVLWVSKLAALLIVVALVLALGGFAAIGVQLWRGYTRLELALYARGLFLEIGIPFAQITVLALLAQVLLNQKVLGWMVMIGFLIAINLLPALGLEHPLYRFAGSPAAPYSDMNGYGHYAVKLVWFSLYWTFCAALFVVLVHLFWVRGRETSFRTRLRLAGQRFHGWPRVAFLAALTGFIATGAWIYYNTNILNDYVSRDDQRDRQARYEQEYGRYEGLPQPRISAVYAEVHIFPERRDVDIHGRYTLVNRTAQPIETLHVVVPPVVTVRTLDGIGTPELEDAQTGYRIFRLPSALAPADSLTFTFDLALETRGFAIDDGLSSIVENGTFFNNYQFFPHIGYSSMLELGDPNERRERGLEPIERMPKLEDEAARADNYISTQSDWIDFETVVSTSADQIALAPGYLQREWTENGRRFFHYRMDAPILGFFAYLSARWEVVRDRWNDVAIEVYHHPAHPYNVARMIDGVKKSLDYFTANFSPYQHRQVRIVEFPRYAQFAQSFPNTIPFSESIGFIARLDDEEEEPIDYPFYVTAHEVAHQWWAHQVIGARMQGATIMSETMSQYSALMVMEKEYGAELMRRFLRYELDGYLAGRGGELIEELPLLRVENQGYVHYRKGSLVMYRLRELFGEGALNAALSRYVARTAFQQPPYTTSLEFLDAVREAQPPGMEAVLEDLFETITLWDVRAREAIATQNDDGTWRVRLSVELRKMRASGTGEETEIPFDDWVEVGVFGPGAERGPAHGRPLLVARRRLTPADSVIELMVPERPIRAGIDPSNRLIDRDPENNVVTIRS